MDISRWYVQSTVLIIPPVNWATTVPVFFFNIYIIIIISTIVIIIGTWLCNMAKNIDFKYPGFWGGGPTDNLSLF